MAPKGKKKAQKKKKEEKKVEQKWEEELAMEEDTQEHRRKRKKGEAKIVFCDRTIWDANIVTEKDAVYIEVEPKEKGKKTTVTVVVHMPFDVDYHSTGMKFPHNFDSIERHPFRVRVDAIIDLTLEKWHTVEVRIIEDKEYIPLSCDRMCQIPQVAFQLSDDVICVSKEWITLFAPGALECINGVDNFKTGQVIQIIGVDAHWKVLLYSMCLFKFRPDTLQRAYDHMWMSSLFNVRGRINRCADFLCQQYHEQGDVEAIRLLIRFCEKAEEPELMERLMTPLDTSERFIQFMECIPTNEISTPSVTRLIKHQAKLPPTIPEKPEKVYFSFKGGLRVVVCLNWKKCPNGCDGLVKGLLKRECQEEVSYAFDENEEMMTFEHFIDIPFFKNIFHPNIDQSIDLKGQWGLCVNFSGYCITNRSEYRTFIGKVTESEYLYSDLGDIVDYGIVQGGLSISALPSSLTL